MKNSYLGFKQEALCNLEMDPSDTLILRYFVDFTKTGKMVEFKHKNETYYWLKYDAITKTFPILNISKDRIYRRLKKLVNLEVLKHITVKKNGTYSFYTFGDKFASLKIPVTSGENNKYPMSKETQHHVENNQTKDYSFNNYSFNNNSFNNIYINIVEYLNHKANTEYKPLCKKTMQLIYSRLSEGFTENDFKAVIDKKVSDWKNTDMNKYLRPQTLFGHKFECYLNEKPTYNSCKSSFTNYEQRKYDFESLEKKLLGWE